MKNLITHGLILLSIILGLLFKYYLISEIVLVIEIIFLFVIEFSKNDCTFLRFFYLKKIYTEWGIFYTGVFGRYLYIYKDIWIFFIFITKFNIKYSNIDNPDKLKNEIIKNLKSDYLRERLDSFEDKKKTKEIKKILNNWSGFTDKQLERDYKISKLL
jgi:hypothetical protein